MACHHHPRGPRTVPSSALHACPHTKVEFGIRSVRCSDGHFPLEVLYSCGPYFHAVSFRDISAVYYGYVLSGFGLHDGLDSYYGDVDVVLGIVFGRLLSCNPNFVPDFGYGWLAPASR